MFIQRIQPKVAALFEWQGFSAKSLLQILIMAIGVQGWSSPAISASSAACPDTAALRPALLVESSQNAALISELVELWSSSDESRVLRFEAYVTRSGRLDGLRITRPSTFPGNERQRLARRLNKLAIRPAHNGSEPITVYANFTLVAVDVNDRSESVLVMNDLAQVNEYGLYYVSPQRIRGSSIAPFRELGELYVIGARIGADGTVEAILNEPQQLEQVAKPVVL